MTGSGLMDFLIAFVGLCLVVGLFYYAIDFMAPDERFKKIARLAVGGVALLVFLIALKDVFFGGGGKIAVSPQGVIEFAIGLLGILVVLYIVYLAVDFFLPASPEAPAAMAGPIKYVIGAIALIALLVVAERALFGGGLGIIPRGRALLDGALPLYI